MHTTNIFMTNAISRFSKISRYETIYFIFIVGSLFLNLLNVLIKCACACARACVYVCMCKIEQIKTN